jgi:hypothetical protein
MAAGGRVRTKTIKGGRYMKICFDDKGSHAGEVMMKGKEKMMPKKEMMM